MAPVDWIIFASVGLVVVIGLLVCCYFLKVKFSFCKPKRDSRNEATLPGNNVENVTISRTLSGSWTSHDSGWSNMSQIMGGLRTKNRVIGGAKHRYSYKDFRQATSNFTTIIGRGAFGTVYKAQMANGEILAVKALESNSSQGKQQFLAEVLVLGRLHHRNLVNLVGYCAGEGQYMLVYDYMSNGSLASHLYNTELKPFSWDQRVRITLDIARGLEYLHDGAIPPVVHRDIKSTNILLDQSFRARLADFGLSKLEKNKWSSNVKGTYGYLDPEYIETKIYSTKSDVYSFGVLLLELVTGRNPQHDLMDYVNFVVVDTESDIAWELIVDPRLDGQYDVQQLENLANLAYKCISSKSTERPSIRDILLVLVATFKLKDGNNDHELDILGKTEEIVRKNVQGSELHLIER